MQVKPGTTIATGTRLASGSTYAGTIAPGELQTFRVNVQWGQNLGAKAIVLEPKPSVKAALDKREKALTIRVLSPEGATSAYGYTSSLSSGGYTYVDTDPVLYRGQDHQMQAGEYTVVIGLIVDGDPAGITIPYQVVVQTVGAEAGIPTYGVPGSVTTTPTPEGDGVDPHDPAHHAVEQRPEHHDPAVVGPHRSAAARCRHRRLVPAAPHPYAPRTRPALTRDRTGISTTAQVSRHLCGRVRW